MRDGAAADHGAGHRHAVRPAQPHAVGPRARRGGSCAALALDERLAALRDPERRARLDRRRPTTRRHDARPRQAVRPRPTARPATTCDPETRSAPMPHARGVIAGGGVHRPGARDATARCAAQLPVPQPAARRGRGDARRPDSSRSGLADAGAHVGQIMDASQPTFFLTYWVRERAAVDASRRRSAG